jgi:hypothetical protein
MEFTHKFIFSLVVNKIETYNFISLVVDFYGICYFFFTSDNF